ncbi:MAG: hypothetical protein HQL31_11090, partial [Planctomycetes bacterium]|nr:hypothetical protein [Planctomycetota bacterium]
MMLNRPSRPVLCLDLIPWLVGGLLLFSFLFPYLNAGYTSNDDMLNALSTREDFINYYAPSQGRLYFLSLHGLACVWAHALKNQVLVNALSLCSILLNSLFFTWLAYRLTKSGRMACLTLLAWASLQTDTWEHYLLTTSPLIYTIPLSLFFLSLITFSSGVEKGSWGRILGSALLYLLTLNFSDMYFPLAFCYLPVYFLTQGRNISCFRALSSIGAVFVLWAAVCLVWRLMPPSSYAGNTTASLDVSRFLQTAATYSLSGFP